MLKSELRDAADARIAQTNQALSKLSDDVALDVMELFQYYQIGKKYKKDDRFRYDGKLFKVNQEHTSQEDWVPGQVSALYTEIAPPGVIDVWKQPQGAHDAYNTGDKVHFPGENDPVYESLIDANIYSPSAYPAGWKLVN